MVLHQDPALLPIIKPNYLPTRKQIINDPALVLFGLLPNQCLISLTLPLKLECILIIPNLLSKF